MKSRRLNHLTSTAVVTIASIAGYCAHAEDAVTAKARAEIEAHNAEVRKASKAGADAETISKMVYSDDVLIVGEGKDGTKGLAAAVDDVKGFYKDTLGEGAECTPPKMVGPVVATATTFSSFLSGTCNLKTPKVAVYELRMLYVWKKLPQGWRCVLEYWGPGKV